MSENISEINSLEILEQKIKLAEDNGDSIEPYVLREIEILKEELKIFETKMAKENRLEDVDVIAIIIRQYAGMRLLAQRINHPTEIYDNLIKEAQIKVVGEEGFKVFFENNKS